MYTAAFLLSGHSEELPGLNKNNFATVKVVTIGELYANQPLIDSHVLNYKMLGKNLSKCYVVEVNNKKILIDGHHTVIAKKLNGQKKVKVQFLKLD